VIHAQIQETVNQENIMMELIVHGAQVTVSHVLMRILAQNVKMDML
jgi:hypothetical protein